MVEPTRRGGRHTRLLRTATPVATDPSERSGRGLPGRRRRGSPGGYTTALGDCGARLLRRTDTRAQHFSPAGDLPGTSRGVTGLDARGPLRVKGAAAPSAALPAIREPGSSDL